MPMRRPALLTIASLALAAAGARADDIGVSLFDGRTFAGWNGDTRTTWRIEEGTIVAGDPRSPAPRNEFLATDREYGDFELRLQWRIDCTTGCNAGIQFRSRRVPDHHEVSGFQADIGPGITGALYDETRRNRFLARPPRDVEARALAAARADGWNDYVIRCQGPRVRLVVNGVETLDYTEADPAIAARGVIALQIHGGLVGTIRYRDIRLVELAEAPPPAAARPARLERLPDRVRATIGGAAFTDWIFGGGGRAKPVLFPLVGPHGLALTRSWPVGPRLPGEPADHPHHESFWFAHGDVNGHDFWTGKRGARIEQMTLESMADGVIVAACRWLAPDGTVVCTDRRTIGLAAEGNDRVVDHAIEITAGADPVVFGDTKEGTLAVRVRPELNVRAAAGGPPATGHYLNAAGDRDGAVWGRPAAWVDLSGTVEGRRVGIACLDHPANPRHPTTWHARDYGLFAANPFGLHDFRGAPAGSGRLELRPGERLTLRHRWILHEGDAAEARIAERFAAWAGTPAPAAAGSAPVSAPPPP